MEGEEVDGRAALSGHSTFGVKWSLKIVGVTIKHTSDGEGTRAAGKTGQDGENKNETREHSRTASPLSSWTLETLLCVPEPGAG